MILIQFYKRTNRSKKEIDMYSMEGKTISKSTVIYKSEGEAKIVMVRTFKEKAVLQLKIRRDILGQDPISVTNFCSDLLLS